MTLVEGAVLKQYLLEGEMARLVEKRNLNSKEELDLGDMAHIEEVEEVFQRQIEHLLPEFQVFTQEYDKENDMVFQYFPMAALDVEQQCGFVKHIIKQKGQKKQGQKKLVGNKLISNWKKVSYNLPDSRFDELLPLKRAVTPLTRDAEKIKRTFRGEIRKGGNSGDDAWNAKERLSKIMLKYCEKMAEYGDAYSLYALSNIAIDSLFHCVFYWIVENQTLSAEEKLRVMGKVEGNLDEILSSFPKKKSAVKVDYPQVLFIFVAFLKHRNTMEQYERLTKKLFEEEQEKPAIFQELEEKYRVKHHHKLADMKKLHVILYEGKRKGNAFPAQLDMTYAMIRGMTENKERELREDSLLDVKVIFRELFISKVTSEPERGVTANTVAKKYLEDPDSISRQEKKFLREKINRGFYRERHSLALYHQQNALKYKIYLCILQSFLRYDLEFICENLNTLFSSTMELCQKEMSQGDMTKTEEKSI